MSASPVPTDASPSLSPELIAGRYLRLEQLGAGALAVVYRVQDGASGRQLALKQRLSGEHSRKKRALDALFEREYHTLVRLKHPRILEVYDYGLLPEGPYYTMELLDGSDLLGLAPLPYRDACRQLRDLASSLALIHAHRLVHGDVSPRNVRCNTAGRAKLIDFGALAPFGTALDAVGTPPCTSPEQLRRMPLDQRADLYALGALAYFALTGRHAYPALQLEELPRLWQAPPAAPSTHATDVPHALDELVLSLLALDRTARPAHAAQVIAQLNAIAELEPEPDQAGAAADSFLQSGQLVGRDEELAWLRTRTQRAVEGRGAEVLLEGPAGIGRTRLLHEVALEGQLCGLCALKADAQATPGELGVANALALALLSACPELARRAAGSNAPQLAQLSLDLREKLAVTELAEDPAERRARAQTALHAWFLAVVREQPLLIAVDNLQAADDSSGAFLAALGHEARTHALIVLVAQRSGERTLAPAPVRALRKRAARIQLGPLDARACEQLVESVFGASAGSAGAAGHGGRVAALLQRKSAGNPQLCMDLAHLLVQKGIAKYQAGAWLLPLDVADDELPTRSDEILAARVAALSPAARNLAQALCIHDKPIALQHALAACDAGDELVAHAALDELVGEQLLLVEGADYRFCQEAMREALRARMDPALRRARHLRFAESLLESAELSVSTQVEAAGHLMRAGRERRGSDVLAAAGREFLRDRATPESVEQVVKALDTAFAVYEAQGRSKHVRAGLMFALIPLAFFTDWRVTLAHGERALRLGLDITGLALAQRLRRFLPKQLALAIGLASASVRLALQRSKGVGYSLPEAISAFCAIIPATIGTYNLCYDIATLERLAALLEPLALFGEGHIARSMHQWACAQLALGQAREADAQLALEQIERGFHSDSIKKVLGDDHWKSLYGGILFSLGMLAPYWFGQRALELAARLEALGVRSWAMAAAQLRLLHHALRGEAEPMHQQREQVELFALQGSTSWQVEMFWPVQLLASDALVGDTIAVRRAREQLTRRAQDAPSLQLYADLADAVYLTLRGEHRVAIARFERLLPLLAIEQRAGWALARSVFAQALNATGQHARAKQLLQQVLAALAPEDDAVVGRQLELRRQLALSEAGLGNRVLAAEQLDGLLAAHGQQDQPLLIGLLHKARAEVALAASDAAGFELHATATETRFRATQNSCLIAQCERLNEQAVRAGIRQRNETPHGSEHPPRDPSDDIRRTVSELKAAADPQDYAVRLLLERSRAQAVHLYELRDGSLQLIESSHGREPAREVEAELLLRFERTQLELADEARPSAPLLPLRDSVEPATKIEELPPGASSMTTVYLDSAPPQTERGKVQTLLLQHGAIGAQTVVGGVILELGSGGDRAGRGAGAGLEPALIDAIAGVLYERRGSIVTPGPSALEPSQR